MWLYRCPFKGIYVNESKSPTGVAGRCQPERHSMGVRGLWSGLQGAKETLRKVKEAAKGVATSLGAENVVEAMVLEDGGTEVCRQSTVCQDMGNRVGGKRFGGGKAGKGVLLAKAPEGICRVVTTRTEGFVALGGAESEGVVGVKAVTRGQLDASRPVPMVEGLKQARGVRWEAVAIGFAKGDISKVYSPRQVVVVEPPALEGSVLARDRGGKRGGRGGGGILPQVTQRVAAWNVSPFDRKPVELCKEVGGVVNKVRNKGNDVRGER